MKIVSVILGIALVAVGGAAIHLWREVGAGRQQIDELKAQLQEREAQPATLTVTPATQPAASIAATAPPATTPAAASGSSAAAAPPAPAIALPDLTTIRAQMSSPEAMARRRQISRTFMQTMHPDIGEALGLSPDETETLLDLLAANQDNLSAVFSNDAASSSPVNVEERAAALRERQQANDAQLQAMLGSKYPQWQDYQETRPVWQQRRDLRAVLEAGGIPLTSAQERSLIAALSVEQRSFSQQQRDAANQGRSFAETMTRNTPERHQRLLDAAAPHLSPQQLEGYRGMLERAAAQEQSFLAPLQAMQSEAAAAAAR